MQGVQGELQGAVQDMQTRLEQASTELTRALNASVSEAGARLEEAEASVRREVTELGSSTARELHPLREALRILATEDRLTNQDRLIIHRMIKPAHLPSKNEWEGSSLQGPRIAVDGVVPPPPRTPTGHTR